jgi:hypothetical protein
VDRDGDPDLVIDNYIGPTQLWLNNGKGNFTAVPGNLGGAGTHGLVFADLNKDSWPDLLVLNQNSPSQLFLGNGAGALTAPVQSLGSAGDNPTMAVAADADGDGDMDLFIAYYKKPNRVWLNDGKARFTLSAQTISVADSGPMVAPDFDKDGDPDLLVLVENTPDQIWLNDGRGRFVRTETSFGSSSGTLSILAADLNGDSRVDLLFGRYEGRGGHELWLNLGGR